MRKRILIGCVIMALAVVFGVVVVARPQPIQPSTDQVGHRIWALSNPGKRLYVHRPLQHPTPPLPNPPKPTPTPTPAPTSPNRPAPSPTSTAPSTTGTAAPPSTGSPVPSDTAPPITAPATDSSTPAPPPTIDPVSGVSADFPMPTGDLDDWRMVYADDFNGSSLNQQSAWSVYNDGIVPSNPNTAYWSPSHVSVADSMLTINASRDASVAPNGQIVSAGLGLWKLKPQTYGKWEMLVRMDACPQVKYAWLLWPYSNAWPNDGEIDFAEDEGGPRTSTVASVLYPGPNGAAATLPQNHLSPARPMSDWHVVGVEWTPGSVKYTLDGQVWGTVASDDVPKNPMTLVMQTESKATPGAVPDAFSSCNAQFGWVVQYAMK